MRFKGILLLFVAMLVATTTPAQYLHQPGDKAIDIEGVTIDGRTYHLYESQADCIILCFWSVDCDYCHDFLKQLRRHVDLKNDYELVTFALADDKRQVQRQVKCRKLSGYHFFDVNGWDSAPFMEYDVNITPTIILIDKDKNIIGEAYDWDEFKELIEENGKRRIEN